jgi:hypothetical protein
MINLGIVGLETKIWAWHVISTKKEC